MTWQYRLLQYSDGHIAIHEVYYNEKDEPESCTFDPIAPFGCSLEEFKSDLKMMARALEMPILKYDDF